MGVWQCTHYYTVSWKINCQFDTNFKVILFLLVSEHMTQKGTDNYTNVLRMCRGSSHKSGNGLINYIACSPETSASHTYTSYQCMILWPVLSVLLSLSRPLSSYLTLLCHLRFFPIQHNFTEHLSAFQMKIGQSSPPIVFSRLPIHLQPTIASFTISTF